MIDNFRILTRTLKATKPNCMRRIILIFITSGLLLNAFATPQTGDRLIYGKDTLTTFSNPLEKYCDSCEVDALIIDELYKLDSLLHPDKYSKEHEDLRSSDCWRGFFAEWIIINNKLYLNRIIACNDLSLTIDLSKIFHKTYQNKVFAEWYTGEIIAPQGKCLKHFMLDYESVYETEIALKIHKGKLKDYFTYQNSFEKKSTYFEDFDSENLQKFIYNNIQWANLPEIRSRFITVYIGIKPNKNGQISKILKEYTYSLEKENVMTEMDNPFIKEAIRIARLIPDWDVIVQRGKVVRQGITIIFDDNHKNKSQTKTT